jgi:hypothetical protein
MPTLTTQLEAVNSMLGHIGESPVASIATPSSLPISASTALTILDEVSREVQSDGWHFNTEYNVTLSPDAGNSNKIVLSTDVIEADVADNSSDIVPRGLTLFDRNNNTTAFTKDIKVTLTRLLDWDSLPEPARRYITLRAARVLQGRIVGSRELEALIARDEYMAKARLEEFDAKNSDRTIFDNFDTGARIGINRNYDIF